MKESEKKLKALYYSRGRRDSFGFKRGGVGSAKRIALILTLPFLFLIIIYVVYKLFFISDPVIEGLENFNFLPLDKTIHLKGKALKSITIFIQQGDRNIELLRDMPERFEETFTLQIKPKELELTDGPATVTVKAKSGILKEVKQEIPSVIDTVPPSLEIAHAPYSLSQGTGGFAVLKSRDADSVLIQLGNSTFRAFKVSTEDVRTASDVPEIAEQRDGSETYFAFFPVPFDISNDKVFYAISRDKAGNQTIRALPTKLKIKKYKTSSITISDSFINTVVLPLINKTDTADPAAAFKKVNEDLRRENQKVLVDISRKTLPEVLWDGPFLQLKNTKVMAKYGDKRTYLYEGKPASRSSHLGYDLASVKNAKVEAANSGVVIFADVLGIYGNTLIIDHGLSLMSLYGHLSSILVKKGQVVEKGEVVARTGSTGLAGGDHLHFGVLIHGHEVSPLHWWDPKWVRVNVLGHVNQ
jgi:murein DD-endopeptidase MepM/ murein hydrolase activator NlpD